MKLKTRHTQIKTCLGILNYSNLAMTTYRSRAVRDYRINDILFSCVALGPLQSLSIIITSFVNKCLGEMSPDVVKTQTNKQTHKVISTIVLNVNEIARVYTTNMPFH